MIIDIENSNVQPVDYRSYQENKAGFIASLLSNNFIMLIRSKRCQFNTGRRNH